MKLYLFSFRNHGSFGEAIVNLILDDIDNTAVRQAQIARLEQIRASRDSAAVEKLLNRLSELAESGSSIEGR